MQVKLLQENLKDQPVNRDKNPGMAENFLFSTGNMLAVGPSQPPVKKIKRSF
jgi:hypothetical protein